MLNGMVELDRVMRIRAADVRRFNRDGHVKLAAVLSHRLVAAARRDLDRAVRRRVPRGAGRRRKPFIQCFNLWVDDERVRRLTLSCRLGSIAAQLMGVPAVRLIHDQALFKEKHDHETEWHADQHYWPIGSGKSCTVWIPLQATPVAMGPIMFASGSNQCDREALTRRGFGPKHNAAILRRLQERGCAIQMEAFAAGDISVHSGWTFHSAGANHTDACRRAFAIHFVTADARFSRPRNEAERGHVRLFSWGSLRPGQRLNVPMCPITYARW